MNARKILMDYDKWYYHRPKFPTEYLRHPRLLFRRWAWDHYTWPSCGSFFCEWLENIFVFLTPWCRPARRLLNVFANRNGTKLLHQAPAAVGVRTRGESQAYYDLRCGFFLATLERMLYVDRETGKGANMFGAAICGRSEKDFDIRHERVLSGPCMTMGQCARLLERIVAATPDCEWYGLDEE